MKWVLAAPAARRRRKKGAAYAGGSESLFGWAAAVVRRRRWRGGRLPERGGEGACARAGQRARMKGLVCTRSLLTRTCTGAVRLQPPPPLLWAAAASAAAARRAARGLPRPTRNLPCGRCACALYPAGA